MITSLILSSRIIRLSFFFACAGVLYIHTEAIASEPSVGHCDPEPAGLVEPSKWAQAMDKLGQQYLRQPQKDDVSTSFGAIIDASCMEGSRQTKSSFTIEKIEKALSYAVSQLKQCQATFGFRELPDLLSILRRMVLVCKPVSGHHALEMRAIIDHGWKPSKVLLGHYVTSAAAEHDYQVSLHTDETGHVDMLDPAGVTSPESMAQQTLDLGSFLFHEALHALPANNTGWHLEGKARVHSTASCLPGAFFEDRIYFIQAACFPRSGIGNEYYRNGIYNCSNTCQTALFGADADTRNYLGQGHSRFYADGIYGPGLLAKPYSVDEAQAVCRKVKEYGESKRTFDVSVVDLRDHLKQLGAAFSKVQDAKLREVLIAVSDAARGLSQVIRNPSDADRDIFSLKIPELLKQVDAFATDYCAKSSENPVCAKSFKLELATIESLYQVTVRGGRLSLDSGVRPE